MDALRRMSWSLSIFNDEMSNNDSSHSHAHHVSPPAPAPEDVVAGIEGTPSPLPTSKQRGRSFFGGKRRSGAFSGAHRTSNITIDSSSSTSRGISTDSDGDDEFNPLTVWTSRYGITCILIAVLINRIKHICRPRGRPAPLPQWKRLCLRLPALVALGSCIVMLLMRSIQCWSGTHVPGQSFIADFVAARTDVVYNDARKALDETLLWMTFISACLAIVTNSVTRTLEGTRESAAAMNLFTFSVTLQVYRFERPWVMAHYFLFVALEVGELFAVDCINTFKTPWLRMLPTTTFFGIVGTLHYLLASPSQRPNVFGFNRLVDLIVAGVILVTVLLHALTMIVTEGKIDTSRLLFTSSNLPTLDEDYSTALFKIAIACLQSTKLAGFSRELVTLDIPEKTYVEIDEDMGARLRTGANDILAASRLRGLSNEVRLTLPNEHRRADRYEAVFLPSTAKWREMKRLYITVSGMVGRLWRGFIARLPRVPLPRWAHSLPRYIRLAWHGQNGERRREERIAARETERAKRRQKEQAIAAALSSSRAPMRNGETPLDAAWRMVNELPAGSRSDAMGPTTPEDEEDREWKSSADDYEVDPGESSSDGTRGSRSESETLRRRRARSSSLTPTPENSRRSRSRSRSVFSPFSAVGDDEDLHLDEQDEDDLADESINLVRAAKRDFDEQTPVPEPREHDRGAFDRVLMAHIASGDDQPLTRSRFRQLIRQSPAEASTSFVMPPMGSLVPSGSSEDSESAAHLRDVIQRRRRQTLRLTEDGEDEARAVNRERMRTCVVCLYEERNIICWPCRCLAMCDGCREELAARPGSSTGGLSNSYGGLHDCPTCRSKVQGFSRVYI